jgi:hypothetical protein
MKEFSHNGRPYKLVAKELGPRGLRKWDLLTKVTVGWVEEAHFYFPDTASEAEVKAFVLTW